MARDGSGNYSLPTNSWNPATNATPATAADWQSLINDVATAITQSVSKDGQTPMTGNLPMGGNKITGLQNGTATTDAVTKGQLNTLDSTGVTAFAKTLLDDADAATAQTTLGGSTVGKAVFTAVNAAAARTTLGLTPVYFAAQATFQTVTSGVSTVVDLSSTIYDNNGSVSLASNRIQPTVAGIYHIDVRGTMESDPYSSNGVRTGVMSPRKNGSSIDPYTVGLFAGIETTGNWANAINVSSGFLMEFNGTTDYLDVTVSITGSGTLRSRATISGFRVG